MEKIKIIKPTLADLKTVVSIEQKAWPDIGQGMIAEYEKFETRIANDLMYMLLIDDKPAGIISFQKPTFTNSASLTKIYNENTAEGFLDWDHIVKKYGLPKDWYSATNDGYISKNGTSTHNPHSNCIFLIGVGVDQAVKGKGLVNHLISHTITKAKEEGIDFVLGYGRLPQLHEHYENPTVEDAIKHLSKLKKDTDLPDDYGARFHVFNGARAVSVIPNAMDDPESKNYGFLALYNLKK
ncbi:MAG: GNAT family N-acetyltransferase [Candidatus Nanoarchaeia archaeon]